VYAKDVPCHVELRSSVGYEKHFGSLKNDRCTGSWHLRNFSPIKFSTIEPGLQFYVNVPLSTVQVLVLFLLIARNVDDCAAKALLEDYVLACRMQMNQKTYQCAT
jgi:hypothetical protein